jgi:hypothetical protein
MLIGALPAASNRATWIQSLEFSDPSDDSPIDFSVAEEITISLRDPGTKYVQLVLTLSGGGVTTPSVGIIHIRAEKAQMGLLAPKTYEVAMEILDEGDTDQLLLGTLPVLGW